MVVYFAVVFIEYHIMWVSYLVFHFEKSLQRIFSFYAFTGIMYSSS